MADYISLNGAKLSGKGVYNTTFSKPLNDAMISSDFTPSDNLVSTLIDNVRQQGACCGSASLTDDGKITKGWYCFVWIPHRNGGQGGADNSNYGVLVLLPMTFTGSYGYVIRYANGMTYQRFSLSTF